MGLDAGDFLDECLWVVRGQLLLDDGALGASCHEGHAVGVACEFEGEGF